MSAKVTIYETEANGCHVDIVARDLVHARRMCLHGVCAVESPEGGSEEVQVSLTELATLRGFLTSRGFSDKKSARRILLMALLELEDEDESRRVYAPQRALPVLAKA